MNYPAASGGVLDPRLRNKNMNFVFEKITYLFDPLHHLWEHEKLHRKISLFLVIFFLAWLLCIELKRLGLFSGPPGSPYPP